MANFIRKSRPNYLSEYVTRPETENARQLNRAINKIGSTDIRMMDEKELKQVARPIIREARARMRQLEDYGLTDSPAYRRMKMLNINISVAGHDINLIKHNLMEAYNFLHAKTSTVENASAYSRWLDEHLGAETTKEQREAIWDLVHRFESTHTQHFINYGYDEAIKRISKAAKTVDFDVDRAYAMFANLLEKEKELDVIGYEPQQSSRRSTWFRGGSSMKDF